MKINKLRLRGFIGIEEGLGLDEIKIDFSDLSGLIAFAGPNGHGKTTILDCMQPYRQMASRNRSLKHQVFLRDSIKELDFEFQGDQYRTLLKIDAESERSEGFIWKNGESLVDGKVTNYDNAINKLLGSSTLFFNSVFCAQNSKKLDKMTTGDLKKLFSEFLRLDLLVEYENTSKQCANLLTSQAEKLEREIKTLKELADIYGEATTKLQDAETDKQRHEQSLAELSNDLKQAETKLADVQIAIQKNEVIKTRIKSLQDSLVLVFKDIKTDREQSQTELDDLRSKYRTIDLEIVGLENLLVNEAKIRKVAERVNMLTKSIGYDRKLLEIAVKDHFATARLVSTKETEKSNRSLAHGKLLGAMENNRDQLMLKIEHTVSQKLSEKEAEKSDIKKIHEKIISAAENNLNHLKIHLKTAKLSAKDLDARDRILTEANEQACESKVCPFIVTALSAQEDIPKIETELAEEVEAIAKMKKAYTDTLKPIDDVIKALREQKAGKKSRIETQFDQELAIEIANIADMKKAYTDILNRINAEIEALSYAESEKKSEKDQLEAKITQSEGELAKIKSLADELPQIDTALTRKTDLEKRKAELTNEGIKIKTMWNGRIANKSTQKKQAEAEVEEAKAKINRDAEHNLPVINKNIMLIKSSIIDRTDKITEISGTILSLEKEIAQKEQAKKDFEVKTKKRAQIINESSEWTYMKNACPATRVLEIDSVAPVVTGYANDLLLSTFGTGETIKIKTLDEETSREIFDILVIRENGKEVLLDDLSGGERVWNLKALGLGITLISKEKSGKNFMCAFADEEDGSLDIDNAQNFVRLYRSFMPAGGFNDFYFISHKPECVAMADHVIKFGDGGITID